MSIRGKCEFCQYVGQPPSYAPCASCYRDEGRPEWRASGAAVYALGLEADLAAAQEELAKHKPEERVGRCFCETPLIWFPTGRSFVCSKPCWIDEGTDEPFFPGNRCPRCGAELGNGVARRNADAALLDALERLALESAEHGEAVQIDARAMQRVGGIGLSAWPEGTVVGEEWVGPDLRAAIRAALDPEAPDE